MLAIIGSPFAISFALVLVYAVRDAVPRPHTAASSHWFPESAAAQRDAARADPPPRRSDKQTGCRCRASGQLRTGVANFRPRRSLSKGVPPWLVLGRNRCGAWSLVQVDAQVALRLLLRARIIERGNPTSRGTVICELPVGNRRMLKVVRIEDENLVSGILNHGETNRICDARSRQPRATARVAQIAPVAQRGVVRDKFFFARPAGSAEAASQRQTTRKGPGDLVGAFQGIKIRTAHGGFILVPARSIV